MQAMKRRQFVKTLTSMALASALPACAPISAHRTRSAEVMTVNGPIKTSKMGITLTHEHLFADVRPLKEQLKNPVSVDFAEVGKVVLPHLQRLQELGCRTLVDATATGLGRHPALLKYLADASGMQILTVTGNYVAAGDQFAPDYVHTDSASELAQRWLGDWQHGIEGTGIRPGLIKIGVDGGPLAELDTRILRAAAITHLQSGLPIGSHTGPWGEVKPGHNSTSAFAQLDLLESMGVSPSAWIWIHAHNEKTVEHCVLAAKRGAWISLDGFRPEGVDDYLALIKLMRNEKVFHRLLLSQDAGWYSAGEPDGGSFTPFDPIFVSLVPALRKNGFSKAEIDTLFIHNPASAFAIGVRRA